MTKKTPTERVLSVLSGAITCNRQTLVRGALKNREVVRTAAGPLARWATASGTGRIPSATYIVQDKQTVDAVDWNSSYAHAMDPETFSNLLDDALAALPDDAPYFLQHGVVGADPAHAITVQVLTDQASVGLFAENMFRPRSEGVGESVLFEKPLTIISLPQTKIDTRRYREKIPGDTVVVTDFSSGIGIIMGSEYYGTLKKLVFTYMNYLLPAVDILPLHCGANISQDGDSVALFLGLSGTGKTTLSADPERLLIGDDEHTWSKDGVANLEGGCYAKLFNLSPEAEPEIWEAVHSKVGLGGGALIENAFVSMSGVIDFSDSRLTENARISFPIEYLPNIQKSGVGPHPQAIIFLTADASGVLPPVARLSVEQALLWFLLGYTSKVAGTEAGVQTPIPTFSCFFGGPFMPRKPEEYLSLFEKKVRENNTPVFLVNTGWTGGPYGVGHRMPIHVSRAIVKSVVEGRLAEVSCRIDPVFGFLVPVACDGVSPGLLQPKSTWANPEEYDGAANRLATMFGGHVEEQGYDEFLSDDILFSCPGLSR